MVQKQESPITIGGIIEQIQSDSKDTREQGRRFEQLVIQTLRDFPEYEIKDCYSWADWDEREEKTGLDAKDIGIDLVAEREDGKYIAIQCKCFTENKVAKSNVDSFLALSQIPEVFVQRWIVTTSDWTPELDKQVESLPGVKRIDFLLKHGEDFLPDIQDKQVRELRPKQQEAVDAVITGFQNHDRGKLIMACGTGKTFISLRIAEKVIQDSGYILFVAPSISLVSQSRKEWLTHTTRRLKSLVICSDSNAGGKKESMYRVSELICDVTTDSKEIAHFLNEEDNRTKVLFCTYQSLWSVIKAQRKYNAPQFDLTICDEAHRTTGVDRKKSTGVENTGFQAVHSELRSNKRLYMTATERFYTTSSKKSLKSKGFNFIDMGDSDIYGRLFFKLKFKEAVAEGMLSDYRVIVTGVHENVIPTGLKDQLMKLNEVEVGMRNSNKTPPPLDYHE